MVNSHSKQLARTDDSNVNVTIHRTEANIPNKNNPMLQHN